MFRQKEENSRSGFVFLLLLDRLSENNKSEGKAKVGEKAEIYPYHPASDDAHETKADT
jgi:hypothetical protein